MLCFGNLLKEAVVTERLAVTARTALIDIATILLGLTVGASTQGDVFLTQNSVKIFVLGALSFCIATACGLLFAKFMNLFLKKKINPLLGAAGVFGRTGLGPGGTCCGAAGRSFKFSCSCHAHGP